MKFLSVMIALSGIAALVLSYNIHRGNVPDSYIPWRPIDFDSAPGPFIQFKIARLKSDVSLCEETLTRAEIEFDVLPDRTAGSCRLSEQVNLDQSLYPYSAPVRGKCALIAALALWEKQAVAPLARQYFDSDVSRITHYGMFSCRNVRGSSRRSQHADANAIDIAAFTLENGGTVSVLNHWQDESAKGEFLREVHARSCGLFNGVLGPDYNALHRDHFHFDLGPYNICR
jgi:hypothetical protein